MPLATWIAGHLDPSADGYLQVRARSQLSALNGLRLLVWGAGTVPCPHLWGLNELLRLGHIMSICMGLWGFK